ncbi:hypothetical protein TNCV_2007181 [Trichonephila clavipes]|nr:hypothetical protein TNCV_2007181 [Trichonephila clavipes]
MRRVNQVRLSDNSEVNNTSWPSGIQNEAYRASTPQVRGSIPGLGKVDSAFLPFSGLINEYQACLSANGCLVVKVSDRGWLVTSSSLVPLKTHRVRERCTLNLSNR